MPYYETVFMARQDLSETQVKEATTKFEKVITDNGGKIHKTENWGLRTLAYPINKAKKAHYVLLELDTPSDALHEMERQMGLDEDIVRHMTIREDELSDGPSIMMAKHEDREDRKPYRGKEAA
jgi:small subunit ribosomal protein S6